MRKARIALMCSILLVLVATGCSKKDLIAQKDQQIEDLDADVQRLQNEIERLEGEVDTQRQMNSELKETLSQLREEQEVWVRQREGLTLIRLDGSATFASARAELSAEAKRVIDRLGTVLERYPDRWVLIEGHTDSRPISEEFKWKFRSNWELSTARANSVLHYLLENHELEPTHIKAIGLGPHHPVDDGSSPDAWAKNRRVEITVGSKVDVERHLASRSK